KMITYEWDSYDEKIKTSRRDFTIHFRKDEIAQYHHDLTSKSKSVPGYVIEHLLKTTSATSIQVLWTEDVPGASKYTEAVYRAERNGKDKPEVKYNKELLKLLEFKSLQAAVDAVPKTAKKARKSRGKIAEGNIMGYSIRTSYNDVYTTSSSFPLSQGGTYIQVDYKKKEYKSDGKDINAYNIGRLASFLGGSLYGFTEFRMKKLGSEWVPLLTAAKAKVDEELKNISVADLNNAGLASNYLFGYHMSNISQLSQPEYRDMLTAGCPLTAYIDESTKVSALLNKYKSLIPILQYFDMPVEEAADRRYNSNLKAAPNCKLALLYKAVKDRYPLMSQLSAGDDDRCKAIIEYINLIDNKIEQESQNVLQLTGTG
ncbi:MAG: hypothetical protein ACXABY_29075, partial [Candidatus Thorarchaeota archaeon]